MGQHFGEAGSPELCGVGTAPREFITVRHPDGLSGTFEVGEFSQKRTNVRHIPLRTQRVIFGGDVRIVTQYQIKPCNPTYSITSKVLTQPDGDTLTWSYEQQIGDGTFGSVDREPTAYHSTLSEETGLDLALAFTRNSDGVEGQPLSFTLHDIKITIVTEPDDAQVAYHYLTQFGSYEGQLLSTDYNDSDGNLLRRVVEKPVAVTGKHGFSGLQFDETSSYQFTSGGMHTAQDGNTYTMQYSDFNTYGVPQQTQESNDFAPSQVRYTRRRFTDNVVFENDTYVQYVLNLPTTVEVSATDVEDDYETVSETLYHSTGAFAALSLPSERKHYGVWAMRYTDYHADGNVKRMVYNETASDTTLDNASGRYVDFSNYKGGQAQTITLPAREGPGTLSITKVVDDNGWVTSIKDLNNKTFTYDYNDIGRIEIMRNPEGATVDWQDSVYSWTYGADGALIRQMQQCALGAEATTCTTPSYSETTTYDGLLRPLLTQRTSGEEDRYQNRSFTHYNQPTFVSYWSSTADASAGTTTTYDALQRLKTQASTGLGTVTTNYLPDNQMHTIDAESNDTTTTYLAYGQPTYDQAINIVSEESVTTTIGVNVFGDITQIRQFGGGDSHTEFRAYDDLHRLCKVSRGDVGITVMKQNVLGEVLSQNQGVNSTSNTDCEFTLPEDTPNTTVTYAYDNLGEMTSANYTDANTPDRTYAYDNNGNLTSLISNTVAHTYTYNELNLLESEMLTISGTDIEYTLSYDYSGQGHVSKLTYPNDDEVTFAPNGFGEPTQVSSTRGDLAPVDYASDVTYYPTGQLDEFTYGNGITHKTTLNPANLPSSIRDSLDDFTALHYSYTYDDNLNVKSLTDHRDDAFSLTNLAYDRLDRLTGVTAGAGIGNSTITYDALGNIDTYDIGNLQNLEYNYNDENQLDNVQRTDVDTSFRTFTYDERGNVTDNGSRIFNFNVANQLVSSGTNTYLYDGHNRRVKQTDSSGTSYSMYSQDGTLLYRETDDGGINYLYLGNRLIAKDGVIPQSAGDQHFYPYGSSVEGEIDDVGYTGHKFDKDLGLSYMQARYYDPMIGRFYSNDPVDAVSHLSNAEGIMGFNRYSYAINNPYKYTDPDGRAICGGFCVGGIIIAAYAAYEGYQEGGATGAVAEASGYNDAVDSINSLQNGEFTDAAISAASILCKACKATTRVRHFTNKSGLDGIEDSGVIKASDQNSVFTVKAKGNPGSSRDVEKQLGIKRGKGNAFVEFDASPDEFTTVKNPLTGATERVFKGDVNLEGRNATFNQNK